MNEGDYLKMSPTTVSAKAIDKDFEELLNNEIKYMTKRELRLRQIIDQRFTQIQVMASPYCEISGDQTQLINKIADVESLKQQLMGQQEQLTQLAEKLALIEVESLPEETQRELKKIKNQLAELRAESLPMIPGFGGPSYVAGISYGDDRNKPRLEDYARGFGALHGELQDELKDLLKARFKDKHEELELPPEEPVQEMEIANQFVEFDPAKCREPIIDKKTGDIRQCQKFRRDGSLYCHVHDRTHKK